MPEYFPGDDRRSAWNRPPDVIACEEHILTLANGLLTWMQQEPFDSLDGHRVGDFFTNELARNPAGDPLAYPDAYGSISKKWLLERTDPDANRMLCELLRSAWQLRMLKERHRIT